MKSVQDFKIINQVAVLEGVAYQEEAKVVVEYLSTHPDIKNVCIQSHDGRYFKLVKNQLVLTTEEVCLNPYYSPMKNTQEKGIEEKYKELKLTVQKIKSLLNELGEY